MWGIKLYTCEKYVFIHVYYIVYKVKYTRGIDRRGENKTKCIYKKKKKKCVLKLSLRWMKRNVNVYFASSNRNLNYS